jgi:hypothetical protein
MCKTNLSILAGFTLAGSVCLALALAQGPPPGQRPSGGSRGPGQPVPDDAAGFEQIFDGKTLANWDGESGFWRVEAGAITGQTTAEKPLKQNTFIIWRGGSTKDFELKLEFRMNGGNSGVQYRSTALTDVGKYVLKGYQADMDAQSMYTGMLYEERGRGFLAERGRFTRMAEGGQRKLIGTPGDGEELKALIKPGDWNQLHIIARGTTIIHVINGRIMSAFLDDDAKGRIPEGLLGMQLHVGPPMKVEFRNIMLKKL